MFVYFKCGKIVKRIPCVTLEDCYKPKVGVVTEERIECALWYKVLVLDSLLVDCEQRTVYWTINSPPEEGSIHTCPIEQLNADEVLKFFTSKETLFGDGHVYDFDPTLDELFDTALHIFHSLCPEVFNAEGNVPTYLNLLRMLHVYILPKIKFQKGDEKHVRLLLQKIEQEHEKVENNIKFKDNSKKNIENSLRKQRENLLRAGNFQSSQYISTLDKGFLRIFLEHLEKDIKQLNTILVNVQAEISPRRNTASGDDVQVLSELRTKREDVNSSLNSAITAREEIKNSIIRRHKKRQSKRVKSQVITTFHVVYLEITKRLQAASQEIRELISIKIKMSSVREAVMLTLQEIVADGESYGYNCKKGSTEIETDLFDPTKKPEEWATLDEKVKVYLQIKQAGFRAKFEKFCTMMEQKCQRLLDEAKLFITIDSDENTVPVSPTTAEFISEIGNESVDRRTCPKVSFAATYSSRWSMGSISKLDCETLCKQVTEHMDDMAYKIAVEIQQELEAKEINVRRDSRDNVKRKVLKSFHSKVYICYEEHVSDVLMPVLCKLYEQSYWSQCENLHTWISNTCLSMCGYGEDRICILIQGSSQHSSSEENSREPSGEIPDANVEVKADKLASMRVRSMTLEQLYAVNDGLDENLPEFFQGALGFDTDPAATNGSLLTNSDETNVKRRFNSDFCHSTVYAPIPEGTEASERGSSPFEVVDIKPDGKLARILEDGANAVSHPSDIEKVQMRPKKLTSPKLSSELTPNKEQFYKEFKDFPSILKEEDKERTLFGKMRNLTQAMQFIDNQLTRLRKENGCGSQLCSDDFIDVIILLLYGLDFQDLLKLYAHINLMIHLLPNFMQGNAHEYSLVTFSAAYTHLFEQMVLQKSSEGQQ